MHLPRVAQWDLPATRDDADLQAAIAQEQADTEALQAAEWQHIQAAADSTAAQDRIAHYHCDHLGTPREMTDAQGNVVWSGRYKAQAHRVGCKGGTINLFTSPTKKIDSIKERLEKTAFFVNYVEAPYASFLNVEDPMGNNICPYQPC